jgi:ComF family protein
MPPAAGETPERPDISWLKTQREAGAGILSWIYPPVCFACHKLLPIQEKQQRIKKLCPHCEELFIPIPPPVCERCGHPLAEGTRICGSCQNKKIFFHHNSAIFVYEGLIRDCLHDVKFRNKKETAIGLGGLLARTLPPEICTGLDYLIPVPMHPKKKRARGFNQAETLAKAPARFFNIEMVPNAITRVRETPPLSRLTPQQRADAMADAFKIHKNFNARGKHIGVIDDIYTTGATLNACSQKLREAGAARVVGITLAITVKNVNDV